MKRITAIGIALLFAIISLPIHATVQTVSVLNDIPQFGIYASSAPSGYTPPPGVVMFLSNQVWYSLAKLTTTQQGQIGSDVVAQVTYLAGCDNYDRNGGVILIVEPTGVTPTASSARIDVSHFITPFSDYTQGTYATHVYPNLDLSPYANLLADTTHDVWVGFAGGSNPYSGDPCTNQNVSATFAATGFNYSLNLVSTVSLTKAAYTLTSALADVDETTLPIATTVNAAAATSGSLLLTIDGHGSESGGDEYLYTTDTLTTNGKTSGTFSTQMYCAAYGKYSPDGNQAIFENNASGTKRNWCPGALVPTRTYPVSLGSGSNAVQIAVNPSTLNASGGDYYATGLNFTTTAPTASQFVNLTPFFTLNGIFTDGTSNTSSGIDGSGDAYSANLIGTQVTWNGSTFPFGTPNATSAATGQLVLLTPGYYSKLNLLATGVNGNQTSQQFVVTYNDGTTTTFTQSLSDWLGPQNYSGETKVVTASYRDESNGTKSTGTNYIYGYTFALNNTKTVTTIQLPSNSHVVVLGAALVH